MLLTRPRINSTDDYLNKVIKYIPAEVQAFYVFAAGLISSVQDDQQQFGYFQFTFFGLLLLTPIWTFVTTPDNGYQNLKKQKLFQAIVAFLALPIWIYNIDTAWVTKLSDRLPDEPILGALILAFFTMAVPLAEKIFKIE